MQGFIPSARTLAIRMGHKQGRMYKREVVVVQSGCSSGGYGQEKGQRRSMIQRCIIKYRWLTWHRRSTAGLGSIPCLNPVSCPKRHIATAKAAAGAVRPAAHCTTKAAEEKNQVVLGLCGLTKGDSRPGGTCALLPANPTKATRQDERMSLDQGWPRGILPRICPINIQHGALLHWQHAARAKRHI